jgi:beta-aspartyl-peptidase (threonine type)
VTLESLFSIAFHGGAGQISPSLPNLYEYEESLMAVLRKAYVYATSHMLDEDITAVDVVEHVVMLLEDDPLFNAGRGSVFTHTVTNELEASIMDGRDLRCGAASMLTTIKNPVSLARIVMDHTQHVCMVGQGAVRLAEMHGLDTVSADYFYTERRHQQLLHALQTTSPVNTSSHSHYKDHDISEASIQESSGPQDTGTVGCVCLYKGNLAAATSTGGE